MARERYPNLNDLGRGRSKSERDAQWWLASGPERARVFDAVASKIWTEQAPERERMLQCARLYGMPLGGLTPRSYRTTKGPQRSNLLSLNVVKAVTDSYVAMLTEDRPKVTFLTSGADRKLQKKAESLETFVDGVFYETDLYQTADDIARDSALFPFGVVKAYSENKEICIERVFPWELGMADSQSLYGMPPELYQYKFVDRLWLQSQFPELATELETSNATCARDSVSLTQAGSGQVMVIEGWHTTKDGKGGMHFMACGSVELICEKFTRKTPPFEMLYRQKPLVGMYALSLAEELRGIQREINIILQKIQRSYHMLAAGHWLVERGSEINTAEIDNIIGSIIKYRGTRPEMITASGVPADVYQQLDRLYGRAFEIIGVPQTFAEGNKPSDLSSGKALETYADIASKRFEPSYRNYQHFFLRLARQVLDLAREEPTMTVTAPTDDFMKTVKAADVLLEKDRYILQLFPTNLLADDPAERLSQAQNLANAGWIPQSRAMRLINFPDLKADANMQNASFDFVCYAAETILDGGKYIGPEPFMDLAESVAIVQNYYLKEAQREQPNEKALKLLLRWLRQAAQMIKAATPAPAPVAPPMPGAPPGAPPAPPMAA